MNSLTIELPPLPEQTAFNMRRWAEVLNDRELGRFQGRVETDRYGHMVMTPPPSPRHGSYQAEIVHLLRKKMSEGRVMTECPISTADGVKASDVAWASSGRMEELGDDPCFSHAPEICVEVVSPSNPAAELQEKMALYLDAGAKEVWFCSDSGRMSFYGAEGDLLNGSRFCPQFPEEIALP